MGAATMKRSDNEEAQKEYEEEVLCQLSYAERKERIMERHKKQCEIKWEEEKKRRKRERKEKEKRDNKKYYEINRTKILKYKNLYAKEIKNLVEKRNRRFATQYNQCEFVNEWFDGCEKHHIFRDLVIHIPKSMHRSVRHNLKTGKGMEKINDLAWQWFELQ